VATGWPVPKLFAVVVVVVVDDDDDDDDDDSTLVKNCSACSEPMFSALRM
jgi:hypothetical protein